MAINFARKLRFWNMVLLTAGGDLRLHRRLWLNLELPFRAVESQGAIMNGSLAELPLGRLLEQLASERLTGVVRVSNGSEIWFNDGAVYLAANEASAPLESVLYGNGTTPESQIRQMLNEQTDVGAALVAADPGSAQMLGRLVHEFNLTALFELVVPSEHTFAVEQGPAHAVGPQFAEPVAELVAQAERRLEIWKQIATRIPSVDVIFKLSSALPEESDERVVTSDESVSYTHLTLPTTPYV